ncbi:hypothetical protein APHAL10511_006513 [Amanita phalloides]|nr:hypothetical protein APHAL10511_006513 [Amanita phalloides]
MASPHILSLDIDGLRDPDSRSNVLDLPDDVEDRYLEKLRNYAKSIPYNIEAHSKMIQLLDFILLRITQCIEAKDYEVGLVQWDSMLTYWSMLKYPLPKERRIKLAKLYFHVSTTPGMPNHIVATCADGFKWLVRSKTKLSIKDMRLPWRPIYDLLSQDLFLKRREFEYTQLSWFMGYIAGYGSRFFHPAAIEDMLTTFVPLMDGTNLDVMLSSQFHLLSFLPLSHPQAFLPMLFRVWEGMNSYMFDERMLDFLAKLAEMHIDPEVSDPRKIAETPDDERSEGESREKWAYGDVQEDGDWGGIYRDVGIFTEHEWHLLLCKCLQSMEIPLADAGSLTTGPTADSELGFEIKRLPKPNWRITSLARIVVYSMALDGQPVPESSAATPMFSPLPSGMNTPQVTTKNLQEFLEAPLGKGGVSRTKTYVAGCKALDSLLKMVASTESFFHPSNSGAWTADLSAFLKYVVYEFNKRWYAEQKPDCKTPLRRRLTREMKRELVKSLRTVTLLAIFSPDSTTVANIQSCLKSMSIMEPDLILHPILERAIPSLEALVETQRTLAVIKALGAVAPALVSREVYYSGAKYLVPILQLLIPGIDLNDPSKTLCTTAFLVEISQYIQIGDLTVTDDASRNQPSRTDSELALPADNRGSYPSFLFGDADVHDGNEIHLSREEEDELVKDSTTGFPDWVASFIRRVIQLFENLPEEGPDGAAGGASENQIVESVAGACNQICVHLSEPLYDLVLNMIYDYASTTVRSNAVRAIHQLVECVANANPEKTLSKFFPFCARNIRTELENGASSMRTTSSTTPIPSDATLHWNLAILRGAVYNDGQALLKYENEFMSLFRLLHDKTYSKRGFSWTGKLLSSLLLTITHTYPLENKFVNPDVWESLEFRNNHHHYWGKLYEPDEVKISWHVPCEQEINFALRIITELVDPTLDILENLLRPDLSRDAVWRNDFCRHLSFVRHAFSGIPTLIQDPMAQNENIAESSDILNEIPEMIGTIEPISSSFCLADPTDARYQFILSLKRRFGKFLHDASVSLRQQGEENTVDAVLILVRSIRTYLLEYGDSRDRYNVNEEQYKTEKNVTRLYAHQKVWPRAVYIRRARFYHSARLHWNSIERQRGPLEDDLIEDVVEWSLWQYPIIRQNGQSLLDLLCTTYDGVRRRALPILYGALEPGTDDDRMKGALWTLNSSWFGKYAASEPSLAPEFLKKLFGCQHNEKPSIQNALSVVSENGLAAFVEPCYLIYDIPTRSTDRALMQLRETIYLEPKEAVGVQSVTLKCSENRVRRVQLYNECMKNLTEEIIVIGNSSRTHWRYGIFAIRCLRTLIRRDTSLSPQLLEFFLEKARDNHPSMRYYAQRAIMKSLRYLKLRTLCITPANLAMGSYHNPLKREVPFELTDDFRTEMLHCFKQPLDPTNPARNPILYDKNPPAWIAWDNTMSLYMLPDDTKSTFAPWDESSHDALYALRQVVNKASFWESLSTYYSEENHETVIIQDDVSCVKSIFQILEDEPLESLRPTIESLLANKEQNKQRGAAEFLAGVIGGSKHWPMSKQLCLWKWFTPFIRQIFKDIKTDTLSIWTSFLEYVFHNKDPRRIQPLVDYVIKEFQELDFNAELAFDAVKIFTLFRAFYEELKRKFVPWANDAVERCWKEINSEHDEVRAMIGEVLAFTEYIMWNPNPSILTAEVFTKTCRLLPAEVDIMGLRGGYHLHRVQDLVERFKIWREERLPGVRAFQSTYDRVGITICKWLFQSVHGSHAIVVFDHILLLMPELFRFTEINDNNELVSRASVLLVRMCGVTPPPRLINPLFDAMFEAIQSSPSWRVRMKALPLLQVFYFRNVPLISDFKVVEILEVLCRCLDDEVVEVREMAATTLSGILRLSPRRSVLMLKDRFVRMAKASRIPDRQSPDYNKAIRQRHAAILGICALVDSYPYTIEKWMPDLLTNVLAEHTYDPIPISTTVRKCARNFKRTHQDTWHEDSKKFDEDQLAALSTLLTGSSYYA